MILNEILLGNNCAEGSETKNVWFQAIWTCLCGRVVSIIHLPTLILTCLWTSAHQSPVRPFYGTADTLFGNSGDVSSGFQSQNGQNYLRSVETYMLHVSILVHIIIIAFFLKMKKCITILTNSTE